jgi:CDGSH-type Zn-finger protein
MDETHKLLDAAARPPHPVDRQTYPDGFLICGGKVRLFGFSEPPPAPLAPPLSAGAQGVELALEPGRYSWCSCGYSQRQPFCDDSHRLEEHATNRKSYKFEALEPVRLTLCLCKRSADPPLCDGACTRDGAGEAGRGATAPG